MSATITIWDFDEMSGRIIEKISHQNNDQISDITVVKLSSHSIIYFGSTSGVVYQMNAMTGNASDIVALESGIKRILYYSKRNRLIIITESMLLCQYSVSTSSSDVSEVAKVKLSSSGRNASNDIIFSMMIDDSVGLIAICFGGERVVRLWQLENGHNAAVIVAESADSHWAGVTCVDYCNGVMVAGTSNSHIIVWKRSSGFDFNRISQIQVKGSVKQVCVGQSRHIGCITSTNDIYLISEQNTCFAYRNKVVAIQVFVCVKSLS
jgi:WD40 repeat protein